MSSPKVFFLLPCLLPQFSLPMTFCCRKWTSKLGVNSSKGPSVHIRLTWARFLASFLPSMFTPFLYHRCDTRSHPLTHSWTDINWGEALFSTQDPFMNRSDRVPDNAYSHTSEWPCVAWWGFFQETVLRDCGREVTSSVITIGCIRFCLAYMESSRTLQGPLGYKSFSMLTISYL